MQSEFVTLAESPGIPKELATPLHEQGVPKEMLGLYRAANELTLVEGSGGRRLVCFGSIAYAHRACLGPYTGEIVALQDMRAGGGDWIVGLVNSSLEQFIASLTLRGG